MVAIAYRPITMMYGKRSTLRTYLASSYLGDPVWSTPEPPRSHGLWKTNRALPIRSIRATSHGSCEMRTSWCDAREGSMAGVRDITDANFDSEVLQSDTTVLVDFWATWCAPCRALSPHVETLQTEHDGKLTCVKMDVQKNVKTAATYKVNALPTLIVFKGGQEVGRQIGAQGGLRNLRKLVERHV